MILLDLILMIGSFVFTILFATGVYKCNTAKSTGDRFMVTLLWLCLFIVNFDDVLKYFNV